MNVWDEWVIVEDHLYWIRMSQIWTGMEYGRPHVIIREALDFPATIVHYGVYDKEFIEMIKQDPEYFVRFAIL